MSFLAEAAIFLAAAVIAVPIAKRLGLGSILGYLAAGAAIGPWGFGWIYEVENILHFAELGVVMLLFLIGLELQPSRLWRMRKPVFGLGGAQVGLTATLMTAAGMFAGLSWNVALTVGLALALSSTAFALQMLGEKNLIPTKFGRSAFSVLLFQDVAAIPIIAIVPFLATTAVDPDQALTLADGAIMVATIAGVIGIGRYVLKFLLRWVADTGIHELFTACGLLSVLGVALLMQAVGLSMALGAFLAGVLLADSEYRHALEADIEPFKGLLLGLFFIAVGMSVNFGTLAHSFGLVTALVVVLVGTKALILLGLGRWSGLDWAASRNFALSISQGGEFAFVIFNIAVGASVMPKPLADLLILVVTISMASTPVLFLINEKLSGRTSKAEETEMPQIPEDEYPVVIAGFGRFGQVVGRMLAAKRIGFTALESDASQIDFVRRFGSKIYYGDASRLDVLRAAGIAKARVFVLAIEDIERAIKAVQLVKSHFPGVSIVARARHRRHAHLLMDAGVETVIRETFLSSVDAGRVVFEQLGFAAKDAAYFAETFRDHDERMLRHQHAIHNDEEKIVEQVRIWSDELEQLFSDDVSSGKTDD